MGLMADFAIAVGALLAAAYCLLLSRRLRALTRLDGDVGKAIAILSTQVDALSKALKAAESSSGKAESALQAQVQRAESAARRLELLMAAGQGNLPVPPAAVSAVAPRDLADDAAPDGDFAPFGRAGTQLNAETRKRVVRQRDVAGSAR